jgi:hypothetical protein
VVSLASWDMTEYLARSLAASDGWGGEKEALLGEMGWTFVACTKPDLPASFAGLADMV